MPIAEVTQTVFNKQGLLDAWAQMHAHVAAVGPWDVPTVHLYKYPGGVSGLTDETTLAEVQVADWAEYLAIALTGWGAPESQVDGSVEAVALPLLQWVGPAAGGGPTVHGCYIKSVLAGTHLLSVHPFKAPVPMTDSTQVLSVDLPLTLSPGPFAA